MEKFFSLPANALEVLEFAGRQVETFLKLRCLKTGFEHELAIRRLIGVEKRGDASKLVISLRNQEIGGHPHG